MLFATLRKIGRQLLYGGSRNLRSYENAIIQATLEVLNELDRQAFAAQVNARERLQRWNSDRMVLFGFADRAGLPSISSSAENYCLAKAKLSGASGGTTAAVMTHRGVLSSIEFSRSPTHLGTSGLMVESISLHPEHRGFASAIDREEHGLPP